MSELMNARENRVTVRWHLLSTASALALLASVCGPTAARAADDDSDRPTVWIELGGQLNRMDDSQEGFSPPLMANRPSVLSPSQKFEKMPLFGFDEDGKISFQPENSDWILSASIRYGRSSSNKNVRQQTNPKPFLLTYTLFGSLRHNSKFPSASKFADTHAQIGENHLIADFQAGKDVGLGMFGKTGSSTFNLGVRFAQFSSKSNIALKSDPDWQFHYKYLAGKNLPIGGTYHSNAAALQAARSFHGLGPSISWNASAPFAGNPQHSELTLDWGLNAAFLFGRQRAKVHHQATGQYHSHKYPAYAPRVVVYQPTPVNVTRARAVTVPNVGGFVGLSFHYADAKVSFGYRADLFFGAMDGGIDAARKENVGFYGPFASVSVGIGG